MTEAGERPVRVGIAWYRADQWTRLREVSVDVPELEATWSEWHAVAERQLRELQEQGIAPRKVPVDIDDLVRWCESTGSAIDGAARSAYAGLLLQHGRSEPG